MVFGKYLLVLFFTTIILACVNMFGYGFSKPIEISFELKANSSTETKIFYRTSEDDSYIDGRSVSYLIAPNAKDPEQYTKMLEMRLDGRKARRAEMRAPRGERMAPPCCPADSADCPQYDKPMHRHRK